MDLYVVPINLLQVSCGDHIQIYLCNLFYYHWFKDKYPQIIKDRSSHLKSHTVVKGMHALFVLLAIRKKI
jgi:hypothetical protein